ncbi:type II secretion system F family protein [Candidatus Gracilibacteria bacterium]|nr:type II secretion system F family protein [Candidatus Gracilibacteria bacterium]
MKINLDIIKAKLASFSIKKGVKKSISITTKEKITFLDSLSSLLNSGIPISNALKIIIYQTKSPKTKSFIETIHANTQKGLPLEESFLQFPKIFNNFDISLIKMGEVTGKLGDVIETIKNKEEKTKELKSKVIGALIYPMVIMTLATAMIAVFMVYVIPKITDMYKDAKVNLPSLTQTVIDISEFLQVQYPLLIVGFIAFIILIKIFKTHKSTKIHWDKLVLKIPIFGTIIQKKILALFSSSMSTLLSQGVMINEALKITASALENDYYEKEILDIVKKVSSGKTLSDLMGINLISSGKESPYFPIELSSIIKIGEQTGKMPSLLGKISIKFNKEIDTLVKNLATAIEPLVIVGVGGIVGTIIMAVMLPFFNMVNVI